MLTLLDTVHNNELIKSLPPLPRGTVASTAQSRRGQAAVILPQSLNPDCGRPGSRRAVGTPSRRNVAGEPVGTPSRCNVAGNRGLANGDWMSGLTPTPG